MKNVYYAPKACIYSACADDICTVSVGPLDEILNGVGDSSNVDKVSWDDIVS